MIAVSGDIEFQATSRAAGVASAAALVVRPNEDVAVTASEGDSGALYMSVDPLPARAELSNGDVDSVTLAAKIPDRLDLTTPLGRALARNMRSVLVEARSLNAPGVGPTAASGFKELL